MHPEDATVFRYMLATEEARNESDAAFEAAKVIEQMNMIRLLRRDGMY